MSTIFNIRNLKLPSVSRASVIIGSLVVVLALVAAIVGWQLYKKLTTNTVVAYFPRRWRCIPVTGSRSWACRVGSIDSIEPAGDKMKVTFHYDDKYKVPANATASILNPSLVSSRIIQLSPPYTGGPVMEDNAVIPIDRTQVPVEYDELRDSINRILTDLGPTPEQPKGPFGDIIESFSDGLAGKGEQINKTLNSLSEAVTTLNEGRGDFFAVIKSLALFVNALYKSDQQFVALNDDLAQFTNSFTNTDQEVATALQDLDNLLTTTRKFIDENGEVLANDVNNLAEVTNAILQPEPLDGLETALHVYPNLARQPHQHHRRPTPAASSVCRSSPTSPTRWSSSAARSRLAAGWAIRSPPSCARSTWHRSSTRSSSTTCRSALNKFRPRDDAAQADRLLRAAAAAAAGLQGHHRAGDLLARHFVLARQPRAGLGHRARHARHRRAAAHREMLTPESPRRTNGRTRQRDSARTARIRRERRQAARPAERLQREHPAAAAVVPAAGTTAGSGTGRDTGRSARRDHCRPAPGPAPAPPGPPLPAEAGGG